MLLAALLLVATALPMCGTICCPPRAAAASIHASMPCCATHTTIAPRASQDVPPATLASSVSLSVVAPIAMISVTAQTSAPLHVGHDHPRAPFDSSPPPFLRNAQLLI